MIEVIAGNDPQEAQRLRAGLDAMGFPVRLTDGLGTIAAQTPAAETTQLIHVSALGQHAGLKGYVAFGGDDSAADALNVIRQGAHEYFPHGIAIDKVSSCLKRLVTEQDVAAQPARGGPVSKLRYDVSSLCASEAMQHTFALAQRVAKADIAVMVSGESGSGKEVVARYIHNQSPRADGPFVALNCAAIPETMLEALLFGHDKGAFTGASEKRAGKFELADKGTLLLDEITEMPVALQAKLLRVLQEKEVERIGSNQPKAIDVRVIATSNRNLRQAVAEGVLREDLYYRLSVFPIELPPLRRRVADIIPLAGYFLEKYSPGHKLNMSLQAQEALLRYPWPGNVRELENCIQRALVLCDGKTIHNEHLGLVEHHGTVNAPESGSGAGDSTLAGQVRSAEEQLLLKTLEANNGVRKQTAVELGISERTLRYKLKQLRDRGVLA